MNQKLNDWIGRSLSTFVSLIASIICDGSEEEYQSSLQSDGQTGTFIKLNPTNAPIVFSCRSDPRDVARVEERTFICSDRKEDAGLQIIGKIHMR